MSRFYPNGSTEVHRIPAHAGMPNGGDLLALFYRAYLLDDTTAPYNNRHVTRREGTNPNAWSAQMGNAANCLRWIAGFSTTPGAWEMSAGWTPNRWHDILIVHDTSSTATAPTIYVDGAAAALTTITAPAGTPSVSPADVYLGNRAAGAAPMWGAIAELAWWKGRLLTPRDVRLLTAYGPDALPRGRTGWWNLDAFGKNATGYVQSHDGPNPIVYSAGSGGLGYAPAPPKRKRRWFNVPLAYVPPAGAGRTASVTCTLALGATGTAAVAVHAVVAPALAFAATATATTAAGITATGAASLVLTATATGKTTFGTYDAVQSVYDAINNLTYKYQVYRPELYDGSVPYGLVIWYPGSVEAKGSWGTANPGTTTTLDDANRIKYIDDALRLQGDAMQMLVVCMQHPDTSDANAGYLRATLTMLAQVEAAYTVDRRRVVPLGFSQGAECAYAITYSNPGVFAGRVVLSDDLNPPNFGCAPGDETGAIAVAFASQPFVDVTTRQYHGSADGTIPVTTAQAIHNAAVSANAPHWLYTEYAGLDHTTTATTALADNTLWSAIYGYDTSYLTASASLVLAGTAAGVVLVQAAATGALVLAGAATAAVQVQATAVCALTLGASGTGTTTGADTASATCALSLAATATATVLLQATVTAPLGLAVAASGNVTGAINATASCTLSLASSATATALVQAQGTAALVLGAQATGAVLIQAHATAVLALAASGTTSETAQLAGSATLTLTASGTATVLVQGTARAGLVLTGLASVTTGVRPPPSYRITTVVSAQHRITSAVQAASRVSTTVQARYRITTTTD